MAINDDLLKNKRVMLLSARVVNRASEDDTNVGRNNTDGNFLRYTKGLSPEKRGVQKVNKAGFLR
jgi:hypothetical protein